MACAQKTMRATEHGLIARYALGFRAKDVWNPPCLQFAHKKKHVADPQIYIQPVRKSSAGIEEAGSESKSEGEGADQSAGKKFFARIGCADSFRIIQASQRNPVVQSEKENVEGLQDKQRVEHSGRL